MVNRSFQIVVLWFGIIINNRVAGNLNITIMFETSNIHTNQINWGFQSGCSLLFRFLRALESAARWCLFLKLNTHIWKKTWKNRKTKFNNNDYHKVPTNKNTEFKQWCPHEVGQPYPGCLHFLQELLGILDSLFNTCWWDEQISCNHLKMKNMYRMVGE